MEEIRFIHENEFAQSIALSEFAFQQELTEEDKTYRQKNFRSNESLGVFVNNKLAAKLTVNSLQIWIHGAVYDMGGIGGVATWPEHRRHGMVSRLTIKALELMRERGQTVSTLAPFSFGFYRKYGWETFMERKTYDIDRSHLPKRSTTVGRVERVDPLERLEMLKNLYEQYAQNFTGMLKRDDNWWKRRVLWKMKERTVIYYNDQGQPLGYMFYLVKNRHFQVKELIYLNEEARSALWNFISNHDSMMTKLTMLAPADDQLPYLFEEPRLQQNLRVYFMVRIVDVKAFVAQYRFRPTGRSRTFSIRIDDPFAPWNEGEFVIMMDEQGKAEMEDKMEDGDGTSCDLHDQVDVTCDIQSLTSLLISGRTAKWLRNTGRLKCEESTVSLLEEVIPQSPCFLLDGF